MRTFQRFDFKKITFILLSIIVGVTFIFSAIAKLPTLEMFGWTIVETTFLNWTTAEWLTRILIGIEFAIGISFILQVKLKKIIIPLSLFILVLFSIYLLMIWINYGNKGNCGCFGELLPMTPFESIIKNLVLCLSIFILSKMNQVWLVPKERIILPILFIISIALPIWLSPPESIYIWEKEPTLSKPIPLSLLYSSPTNIAPKIKLRKGKHIISFLSLTCTFCRKAAIKMRIMKSKNPTLPFYFILNGDTTDLKSFQLETNASNIPFTHFNGPDDFLKMNGSHSFPSIKWVEDTTVVRESNYVTLDENEILKWIKQ